MAEKPPQNHKYLLVHQVFIPDALYIYAYVFISYTLIFTPRARSVYIDERLNHKSKLIALAMFTLYRNLITRRNVMHVTRSWIGEQTTGFIGNLHPVEPLFSDLNLALIIRRRTLEYCPVFIKWTVLSSTLLVIFRLICEYYHDKMV